MRGNIKMKNPIKTIIPIYTSHPSPFFRAGLKHMPKINVMMENFLIVLAVMVSDLGKKLNKVCDMFKNGRAAVNSDPNAISSIVAETDISSRGNL